MTSRVRRPVPSSALVAASLALCLQRQSARADDSIEYKFENYREEDGRITVETQSGQADEDIGTDMHVRLTGTIDAVSGATPTGIPAPPGSDQVDLTEIHTRRKAWSGDFSRQFKFVNVDVGFAESREPDYVSDGWSVNTLTDFNEKNTTLRAGVAGTYDRVEVFFKPAYLPKHTHDAVVGITQLVDPHTFVTLNVTWGRATGYLAEPHKFVEKNIEVITNIFLPEDFGENSPDVRDKGSVFASLNHAFGGVNGAVEASYRFYADTFGVAAHTLEVSWFQHLGASFILEPSVRLAQQGAAKFYYYNLNDTPIIPVHVPTVGAGPFYSSDFRLSSMDSYSYGLRAVWKPSSWTQLDVAYEQYDMRGRDGVTPQSAYPRAGITTVGIKFLW
ncbi:MAG TPA: DUF3570 domain-containing protein [Opitutaceae bacterium]|nr:DUF3570 domain-containing protein [Opitutaceae bacterium]